jgi:glutamate/tyrosine decarboxylase-like PLP-dependent enzyme
MSSAIQQLLNSLQPTNVDGKSFAIGAASATSLIALYQIATAPEGAVKDAVYSWLTRLPITSQLIARENAKMLAKITSATSPEESSASGASAGDVAEITGQAASTSIVPRFTSIPEHGMDRQQLLDMMANFVTKDCDWQHGRAFGFVYHGGAQHVEFMNKVYALFSSTNPLHTSAFPSVQRMEAQVVRMTADMLHGDANVCGTMTSGGTESLLMALKTYRDYARTTRGITRPEVVLPITAHPALAKGAHYFCIKLVYVDVDPVTKRCNLAELEKAINRNTICIVGSAPAYPHGVVDPIPEMAALAQKKGVPMHVDGCLGGFVLPWVERLGYKVPVFDFRNPGVTSMSADVHKYGYAAKGASIVLYRNKELRQHQFFATTNWPGGLYASPSVAGSRPGGLIATAWASMIAMGQDGYMQLASEIMKATKALIAGVNATEGLYVIGEPEACIFAIASDKFDVLALGDGLSKKGWHIERQQNPPSLHCTVTARHVEFYEDFIQDLREVVRRYLDHPEEFTKGLAAIYGASVKMPSKAVEGFMCAYLDQLYNV